MRILTLMFFLFILFTESAFAITPLNAVTIEQAKLYGATQCKSEFFDFAKPWCTYEETSISLDESAEYAHLYTHFLLIAAEARERAINKTTMQVEDTEKIITDYVNLLSFSIKLNGDNADFSKGTRAFLKQGENIIPVIYANIPEIADKIRIKNIEGYVANGYFYFDETKISKEKPIVLIVLTNDNREHRFFFDLKKIK